MICVPSACIAYSFYIDQWKGVLFLFSSPMATNMHTSCSTANFFPLKKKIALKEGRACTPFSNNLHGMGQKVTEGNKKSKQIVFHLKTKIIVK